MIRAQRNETFRRSCTDTGYGNWWGRYADTRHMYSGRDGMQRRGRRGLRGEEGVDGRVALIYSHVLAIVSPGFDCPCCLENYRARRIPPRHLQAEVRALRFRNIAALSDQQDVSCVIASQLPSYIRVNYKRTLLHTAGTTAVLQWRTMTVGVVTRCALQSIAGRSRAICEKIVCCTFALSYL